MQKKVRRINVIGSTGSGKSEFSRRLADAMKISYIEIDSLSWEPNWRVVDDQVLIQRLEKRMSVNEWVLDGNYNKLRNFKWKNTDMVVWLDYPFCFTLFRLLKRTIGRALTRKELWEGTGNSESFRMSFFSKDSILLWLFRTYRQTRKKYSKIINENLYPGITFIRITKQSEAERFLKEVNNTK